MRQNNPSQTQTNAKMGADGFCTNCRWGFTGVYCDHFSRSSKQAKEAEAAAKQRERIKQSQAVSDAFKDGFNRLADQQQQNASQGNSWEAGAKDRESNLQAMNDKVANSLDLLSEAQERLACQQKARETRAKIVETQSTIKRIEEAKGKIQVIQGDMNKANSEGERYAWAAQLIGVVEMLDGLGVAVSAFVPEPVREAMKKGKKIGGGIGEVVNTPAQLYDNAQKKDYGGAVVTVVKGVSGAVGASTAGKNTPQQYKDFDKNLGRVADVAEIGNDAASGETDKADYNKAKFVLNEIPGGERVVDAVEGVKQVHSGYKKASEMQDEKNRIAVRAASQQVNFDAINLRVDDRLTRDRTKLQELSGELAQLNNCAPKSAALLLP